MRGKQLLQHWNSTQTTVALSSGKAELTGICRGASLGVAIQAIWADLGPAFSHSVHSDATAAIGMCRRRGLGKIRHLAVADLWVQDKVRSGDFQHLEIAGAHIQADALTKHISKPDIRKHLAFMNLELAQSSAETAPTLSQWCFPSGDHR